MGMSEAVGDSATLDGPGLAAAFEAGLAKLRAQTPAKLGDKTMVDALVPAVEALRQAADAGRGTGRPSGPGGRGRPARRGEDQRVQARFGRARNLGPRTIGHVDPGATSIALLFAGFRDGVK